MNRNMDLFTFLGVSSYINITVSSPCQRRAQNTPNRAPVFTTVVGAPIGARVRHECSPSFYVQNKKNELVGYCF